MRYVLDTNILAAALNQRPAVVSRLNGLAPGEEAILPAIVLAELRYGALCSQKVAENQARIDRLLPAFTFCPVSRAVAERFAEIKAALRRRGITKSDADLLIAATSLKEGAILVSNDQAFHDQAIDGLAVEDWIALG